jgi:cellulose synthase/poly-beta-1,6-N-acetylglucosamine synthase-like glycosyltransferase
MTVLPTELEDRQARALEASVRGLLDLDPTLSASSTMSRRQLTTMAVVVVVTVTCGILWPAPTGITLVAIATAVYLATLADRINLFFVGVSHTPEMGITDEEALAIPSNELPIYTVFVPAFDEPQVVDRLLLSLGSLNYPADRLDIKLLLEADDIGTVSLVEEAMADGMFHAELILVPPAEPRTKPKACNFGLQFALGELATIYDAEDLPDPLQLRRAVVAFSRVPSDVACLQAKLSYHNDRQNLLTRWFSSEYNQWFGYLLPGLMYRNAPIPLGGTSNHIRTRVLHEVGGWDPFNVTEDADLGIRLAYHGYRTVVLDSVTLEEANSDTINWLRQRSRWYKGYLQTFLVHTRHPLRLWQALGAKGFLRFTTLTAGTPIIAVINMAFWALAIAWELGQPAFIREIFPGFVFYPALASLILGNASIMYCGLVAARVDRTPQLLIACITVPIYWVLMSVAAVKAFVQLVFQPSYWEKTAHGLDSHRHTT